MIALSYNPPVNRRRLTPAAIVILASFVLPAYQSLVRAAELMGIPIFALLADGTEFLDAAGNSIVDTDGTSRLADGTTDDCCCGTPVPCAGCTVAWDTLTVTLSGLRVITGCRAPGTFDFKYYGETISGTWSVPFITFITDPPAECIWELEDIGPNVVEDEFFGGPVDCDPAEFIQTNTGTVTINIVQTTSTFATGGISVTTSGLVNNGIFIADLPVSDDCVPLGTYNNLRTDPLGNMAAGVIGYDGTVTIS